MCDNERQRRHRTENKEAIAERGRKLVREYGITLADYDAMLEAQGGVCAICSRTPEGNGKRLAVDHCHETGQVRGLLCRDCNRALGGFQDDVALLAAAIQYLEEARVD